MKGNGRFFAYLLAVTVLSATLAAETGSTRYDSAIQTRVVQEFSKKQQFKNVTTSTEDGIVTLTGSVGLYQQKLEAARQARKIANVQGVRNLIGVSSTAPDAQLEAQLDRKLYYDRIGYDNVFDYVGAAVKDGVVTLNGATYNDVGRDSAFSVASYMPGVKDVVNNIQVQPASNFDDRIRRSALRAIYRDPVLSRYAADPALPIRIVVENGRVTLYGTVLNAMDKQVAGIRANQVFGVFSVKNNLEIEKKS